MLIWLVLNWSPPRQPWYISGNATGYYFLVAALSFYSLAGRGARSTTARSPSGSANHAIRAPLDDQIPRSSCGIPLGPLQTTPRFTRPRTAFAMSGTIPAEDCVTRWLKCLHDSDAEADRARRASNASAKPSSLTRRSPSAFAQ